MNKMEIKNGIKSFAITLLLIMLVIEVRAYDFEYEGLCYVINADGEIVTLTYSENELM